jgi:predicted oxidoreductase
MTSHTFISEMSTRRQFVLQSSATAVLAAAAAPFSRGKHVSTVETEPMKTYRIPHTDLVVSRIAYGCAEMGGAWDNSPISDADIAKADRVVHTAHDYGITLFDHADLYTLGKSEIVFGEVLKRSPGLRNRIIIQSKCGQVFADEARKFEGGVRVDLSGEHIVRSVDGSLKRLGTDRLDVLLLHAPTTLMRADEVAQAFETLHRSGRVRYFGVSNFTGTQIKLLKKTVRQPLIANQVRLGLGNVSLLSYGLEFTLSIAGAQHAVQPYGDIASSGTFDYCRLQDVQIQAYSPLRGIEWNPKGDASPQVKALAQKLRDVAQLRNCAPAVVGLSWLLHHPAGVLPITGATSPEHIIENCAADRLVLSDDEWYALLAAATDAESRSARDS